MDRPAAGDRPPARVHRRRRASYLPYSAIERVARGKSLLGSYVALHTGGHEVRVKWINARRVRPFVRAVRAAVRESRPRRRWCSAARSATP